jgi:hypothetical protein
MSAGGISYSGITNYGVVTLPSVEGWGTNMNILRDPPKSIMTRRINKVGETSSLTELVDESGDRACEGISVYARGVNPSVSVDYGNNGNNGGQRGGGAFFTGSMSGGGDHIGTSGNVIGSGQAYLPYRVGRDGSFRPPVQSPFNLLPLSRMPRTNTKAFTQPGFIDFSKKMVCPGGKYKEIKEDTINTYIRPTATYKIETPIVEPFEVKYVIKNPVKFDNQAGVSGTRTRDLTIQDIHEPTNGINKTPLHSENIYANYGSGETVRYVDNSHLDTERYIQDRLHSSVQTKRSKSIQITPIEDIFDVDIRTKDVRNISFAPLKTGYTKEELIHNDVELQKRVLATTASTNKYSDVYIRPETQHQGVQKRNRPITYASTNHGTIQRQSTMDITNRGYNLKPTITVGGMEGIAQKPLQIMNNDVHIPDTNQTMMNKKVLEMQLGRWV